MKCEYESNDANTHKSSSSPLDNGIEDYNRNLSSNVKSLPNIKLPEPSINSTLMTDEEAELVTILNKVTSDLTTVREEVPQNTFTKKGLYFFVGGFLFPVLWFIGSFVPKRCKGDKRMERWRLMNRISALLLGVILTVSVIVITCLHVFLK
ncbi:hypothetical protein K501DRAFT_275578 [Backusella circina FSU 941]|nr:hypothetical protein K501DRAFT_275578 [Backusella circina FSU 941]